MADPDPNSLKNFSNSSGVLDPSNFKISDYILKLNNEIGVGHRKIFQTFINYNNFGNYYNVLGIYRWIGTYSFFSFTSKNINVQHNILNKYYQI